MQFNLSGILFLDLINMIKIKYCLERHLAVMVSQVRRLSGQQISTPCLPFSQTSLHRAVARDLFEAYFLLGY